ncbi:InlB B-repeat-containing protein [Parabacteroides sp. APC149_11_2_Y6]
MKRTLLLLLLLTVAFSSCKKDDPVIVEYTVSFESNGGSGLSPVKVPEGGKVTKPGDPIKEGETFLGWYKETAFTTVWDFEKDVVTQNLSLYARWAKPEQQVYTVSFETNGGSEVAPLKVIEGDKLAKPTDPVKTDCSFLGWYIDAALTEAWQFNTYTVKGNLTLYARWSNPGEVVYTVSFDTDGGSEIEAVSVLDKETVLKPANPEKTGFEFKGWYSDPEKVTVYDFESLVTADITLYAKWLKSEVALVDFNVSELAANGIEWDAVTKTLDITNATGSATLYFNVSGVSSVDVKPIHAYDTHAKSIGGVSVLDDMVITGATVDGKIGMEVKVPVQDKNLRVPLDVYVTISDAGNAGKPEIITITSRPDYNGTGIQPVMMKTTDDKLVFWAPVNAEAKVMPEKVSSDANTDITESCGQLFQWGRKFGFAATNKASTTDAEKFDGTTDPLGFPKGQGALAEMSKWDGKFIFSSSSTPNTQYNWLLFNEDGSDNPANTDMVDGEWYQKLWNKGTEDAPVKTEYDPCPEGWRVPTLTEWKAIGAGTTLPTESWDGTNKLLSIAGAESGQKLILPAAGNRLSSSGASSGQGSNGYYCSSSVPSGSVYARSVHFGSASLNTGTGTRAGGFSVRCVQE